MRYVDSLLDLVGNTPLLRLQKVTDGARPTVLAKVEYLNPGGSVKDRIALRMVEAAEKDGLLRPGGTIVEPTSGNTGVGLAIVAQARGYSCVFVCPDKVGKEKRNVLEAYGARVVVCPTMLPPEHPDSYYSVSDRLARDIDGGWKPDQYANPNNPVSHYETTGPEIWAQTDGRITHFVTGVGTGGTISGTGRYLKEVSDGAVQVVGADPEGSVYSGGTGRPYLVEGVGEDFWPAAYDRGIADRILAVSDAEAFRVTRRLAREEALLVGGSSGMAAAAAIRLAAELDDPDAVIVVHQAPDLGAMGRPARGPVVPGREDESVPGRHDDPDRGPGTARPGGQGPSHLEKRVFLRRPGLRLVLFLGVEKGLEDGRGDRALYVAFVVDGEPERFPRLPAYFDCFAIWSALSRSDSLIVHLLRSSFGVRSTGSRSVQIQ